PYFEAGLSNNEFCMWITSEPLNHEEVKALMRKRIPEFDEYLKKGQIEIKPYSEWYLIDGRFDFQRVLSGWVEKLEEALKKGYDGLRLTGNTFWLEGRGIWDDFNQYEHEVNKIIGNYKMIAICTYSLIQCGAGEILDVVNTHQFALLKHKGSWELIESSQLKETKHALQKAYDDLEIKIKERTKDLEETNKLLQKEINERKSVEDALRRSRDLLAKAESLAHIGIWDFDFETGKITRSDEMYHIFGVNPVDTGDLDRAIWDKIHPDDREKVQIAREEDFRLKHKNYPLEYRIISSSGIVRTLWAEGELVFDQGGKAIGMRGTIQDITERKRAEAELHEMSAYNRSLIEASLDPLVTIGEDGTITDANHAAELITGRKRSSLIGTNFSNYFTDPGKAQLGYKTAFETGFVQDLELELRHIDGHITPVMYSAAVFRDNKGTVKGVFAAARDLTEHKRAEAEVQEMSAYNRSLIEASLDPLVTIGEDGIITDANHATELVTGRSRSSLIGTDFSNYFTDPGKAQLGYKTAFEAGFVQDFELELRHVDGHITPVMYNAAVFKDNKGTVKGIFAAARDLTERKRKDERIQEQAALLDKANDAIIVVDSDNRVIYWNKSALALYGWKEEEVKGKNLDDLIYKNESAHLEEARKAIKEKGNWRGELPQVTKAEKDIIVESSWTLTRDKSGNPKLLLIINTDITEKKNLESQLLRSQRLENIYTITGGIAHDLNNVLTPIMLSGNILKRKITDEQGQKLLNIISENSERGANLIKQIMLFARGIEGDRKELQINRIINQIEKILTETFPKNIEIRAHMNDNLSGILGDETQLHQVLINLCVNARDAMPDGGNLIISAENIYIDEVYAHLNIDAKVGSYVMIAISDNGIGMSPAIKEKLFIPFFTTKGVGKGTGLGLSTVLGIVRSHGGFINVYSEPGKGSTFKVYFPGLQKEGMQARPEQRRESPVGHGELIFVVDDESQILEIMRGTLEDNGYKVVTAVDGANAVAIYAQKVKEIDAVIMDMMMPIMDGPAAIRALRTINPTLKIIGTSGLLEGSNFENVVRSNIQAFLAKPFTAEKLLTTVRGVLDETYKG
ncbi:MAG: PAS domain S-box protein, partial [Candidatus Helarchaeota archaeon]|nr:PAS domain S-box protein [Candidatus Helarchaeota archaeon]